MTSAGAIGFLLSSAKIGTEVRFLPHEQGLKDYCLHFGSVSSIPQKTCVRVRACVDKVARIGPFVPCGVGASEPCVTDAMSLSWRCYNCGLPNKDLGFGNFHR